MRILSLIIFNLLSTSRIALFPGASSICALESLGTEADASTLRSTLKGEVFWVMIRYPLMRSHSDIR
jgi:hypothetical protein